ncbi:hypothetical protein [Kribbella sp. NPDC055071]
MTTKLDPPSVPSLTPAEHARLRNRVLDRTQPRRRSAFRWLAPAISVAAVGAVVAATLVITHPPTAQPDVTAPTGPTVVDGSELPTTVDLGPVPSAEAAATAKVACTFGRTRKNPVEVLWARRMTGREAGSRSMMLLIQGRDLAGGNHTQGVEACYAGSDGGTVPDERWSAVPTQEQGLLQLTGGITSMGGSPRFVQNWIVYRARPEIARIESRYVVGDLSGPWITGIVANGYAVADSRIEASASNRLKDVQDLLVGTVEIRAYDANGQQVPVRP